ncbi:sensor histidine kinase [Terrisporobacter sp.]
MIALAINPHILWAIEDTFMSQYIYTIIVAILTIVIYIIISYKKNDEISSLIESVEIIAKGDLEKRIDIKSNDDIGNFANNINIIIERLKDITDEERKAQQIKNDLITNISHDLRTPLTSIIGYLHLIEEDNYKDEVHLRYYTKIAYEKSKDLNIIINDLFELTKLQNKSLPLNKINMNLVELINQVISFMENQLSQNNMKVRTNFSNDKLIIYADADKIVRVFENLINNAMKYGSDGKYIDIFTKKEDNNAVVEIINYGEPIPQSDIPFIFDRFYRVEKSRNRNDGGSGLGLAITKNIVEVHGGKILVISNSDKTTFKIVLPLIESNQ